ncbi:MAG: hypothetical protein FWG22_03655 [Prolixibacteraceae bacterium]|nr:hypothetical protein [Prolixibacteraceae bacterium]
MHDEFDLTVGTTDVANRLAVATNNAKDFGNMENLIVWAENDVTLNRQLTLFNAEL